MKVYRLQRAAQFNGASFTHLFILGTNRGALGVSDFSAGAATQTFNLLLPAAGDVLLQPAMLAYTKIAFAGPTEVRVSLGYTGTLEAHKAATDCKAVNTVNAGNSATAQFAFDGAKYLTAIVDTNSGANLSTITAGEIWIYACLAPLSEMLTDRYG